MNPSRLPRTLLLAALLCAAASAPLVASVSGGATALNIWSSNLQSYSTINFNIAGTPGGSTNYGAGYTDLGVTFNGLDNGGNFLYIYTPTTNGAYDWGTGSYLYSSTGAAPNSGIRVSPGTNTFRSVAFDLLYLNPPSQIVYTIAITEAGGQTTTFTSVPSGIRPEEQFVGFHATNNITLIRISSTEGFPTIDNFRFGSPATVEGEVPEAASLSYIGIGLAGILIGLRKRARK